MQNKTAVVTGTAWPVSPKDHRALLVELSHAIGKPELDAVILGEGNTSMRVDNDTFLVKASGCQLSSLGREELVHLRFDKLLPLLDAGAISETDLSAAYEAAKVDQSHKSRSSVETLLHAICLQQQGVQVVAHTHPTAVNGLTCSVGWPAVLEGRVFPDEAVVLGADSVFVPYVDPGVKLARAVRDGIVSFIARYGFIPKTIYMQNHGLIALGGTPIEVLNITAMAIKAARIRLAALQAGGIQFLDKDAVAHLLGRPDEKYRMAALTGR